MSQQPIDVIPLWLLLTGTIVITGLALEGGYRYGQYRHRLTTEEKESPVGAMVASILALFAFMLAFTFGMAGTRFEARRDVILREANSIGTTYLRARLLHEPQRTESLKLLREYIGLRIRGSQQGETAFAIERSEEIHVLLWNEALKEAAINPSPITGLYLASLNETIDIHTDRVQIGMRNRIPSKIWLVLFSLGILSMASVGYQAGLSVTRRSPAMTGLIVAFSVVIYLIADLERPQEGLIQSSREALVQVQESMKQERP